MNVAMMFPMALAFVTRRESTLVLRIASAVTAALVVTTIVLTHSRGSLIGFAAGVAVWAFRERRRVQAILVGFALLIGLLVFAPPTFWRRSETIAGFQADSSAMSRVHAWEAAANMNKARPLLGIGTGAFLYGWPIYRPAEERAPHVAHNVFLDVVSELGFVGLLLFLIFLGGAVGGAFQASRFAEQAWLARGIAAGAVTYLTGSLFLSGYTLSAHLYVLCGLAACADRISRRHWAATADPGGMRARAVSPPMTPFAGGLGH
jgi:O-antigen ligase